MPTRAQFPLKSEGGFPPNFPLPPPPLAPPGGPPPPPLPPGGPVPPPPGGFPPGPLFPMLGLVKKDCDWVGFLIPTSVRAVAVDVCVIDMVCAKLCDMPVLLKELCVCLLASELSMFIPVMLLMGRIDCLPSW